ncbi:clindamycin resistance transfer factor BtgB, partial [Phocaeicola vulgatus]
MIVKVQGGGKVYANTGSCSDVVSYLQHEDAERLQAGLTPEP